VDRFNNGSLESLIKNIKKEIKEATYIVQENRTPKYWWSKDLMNLLEVFQTNKKEAVYHLLMKTVLMLSTIR